MHRYTKIVHGRHEGKIVLKDRIVDGIIFLAISELPYVSFYTSSPFSKTKGNENIKVTLNKGNVSVNVYVKIHYSQSVSDTAFKIQESVRHNIESMTEYRVMSVNVIVKGVTFEEKPEQKHIDAEEQKDTNGENGGENSDSKETKDSDK